MTVPPAICKPAKRGVGRSLQRAQFGPSAQNRTATSDRDKLRFQPYTEGGYFRRWRDFPKVVHCFACPAMPVPRDGSETRPTGTTPRPAAW